MDGQFWRGLSGLCAVRQEWHGRERLVAVRNGLERSGRFGCVMVRPVAARFCRQVPVGLASAWQGGVWFVPIWYGEAVMAWWCVFRCVEVSSGGAWQVI